MNNATLNELIDILNKIKEDDVISPIEIDDLQEWVDCNAVKLIGDLHNKIICPLQKIIDDGEVSDEEYENIMGILQGVLN